MLPLWFADKADYARIGAADTVETVNLSDVFGGRLDTPIRLRVTKRETGEVFEVATRHTLSTDQVRWLEAGSALNAIRALKTQA